MIICVSVCGVYVCVCVTSEEYLVSFVRVGRFDGGVLFVCIINHVCMKCVWVTLTEAVFGYLIRSST